MASKMMGAREFENHVKQIVFSFPDKHEFEVRQVLEQLYFTYGVLCSYEEVIAVLEKFKEAGRLVHISGQRYKTSFSVTRAGGSKI